MTVLKGSAIFSPDRTLRYEIRRWWAERPTLWAAWLMQNPSVAGAERSDPTADRVTHFSKAAGCDGWIGVNLYPYVSSRPDAMWRWAAWHRNGPDWSARDALQANLAQIERVAREAHLRLAAFGASAALHDEPWVETCLMAFTPDDRPMRCLGTGKSGWPLHPMARGRSRVPDDRPLAIWRRP
ncbi:MAG: DUF1643 domain-containing protein [Pseudomonadota bacterium]